MKWIVRFMVFVVVIGGITLPIITRDLDTPVKTGDPVMVALGSVYVLSGIILFVYFLYHWAISSFVTRRAKQVWLVVMLVGTLFYYIGPLFYYLFVYEKRAGLLKEKIDLTTTETASAQ